MPDAWTNLTDYVALEARMATPSVDRAELLAEAGLDGIALVRLRRGWDRRFADDPELEDDYITALAAERIVAQAPPAPAPVVQQTFPDSVRPSSKAPPWALHAGPQGAVAPGAHDAQSMVPIGSNT